MKWLDDEPATVASTNREKLAHRALGFRKMEEDALEVTICKTPERQRKTHHPLAEFMAI